MPTKRKKSVKRNEVAHRVAHFHAAKCHAIAYQALSRQHATTLLIGERLLENLENDYNKMLERHWKTRITMLKRDFDPELVDEVVAEFEPKKKKKPDR